VKRVVGKAGNYLAKSFLLSFMNKKNGVQGLLIFFSVFLFETPIDPAW